MICNHFSTSKPSLAFPTTVGQNRVSANLTDSLPLSEPAESGGASPRPMRPLLQRAILLCWLALAAIPSLSQAALFKVATLAPEGSVWAEQLARFADEVRRETKGAVAFRIYYGGVMGDDRVMYRKMRIGQLQGAGMTVTGLAAIVPDFRLLSIPFLFADYDEVDMAWREMLPYFRKEFRRKGLELLAATEVGFVYTMSTKPVRDTASLRATKCWVPNGDPLSRIFLEEAGVHPTPLALPDVLTSLETGMVQTVFNGYYGAIVLQWFTRTAYVTDIPFGYAYGGLLLNGRAMRRLTASQRAAVEGAAQRHLGPALRRLTRQSNAQALATLQQEGITVVQTTPASRAAFAACRDRTVQAAKGKLFSSAGYEKLTAALSRYRASRPASPSPSHQP